MSGIGTVESLHQAATDRTGLTDFGPSDYLEGFQRILDSYEREAALTPWGTTLARDELIGILIGRLSAEDGWKRHPGYRDVAVDRPVFVVGMPRTGSTTLHRMLSADPGHQGLETWLGFEPQPRPERSTWPSHPAFQRTRDGIATFLDAHPGYRGVHNREVTGVEECWMLTRQSVITMYFEFTSHVPGYSAWRAGQDMTAAYLRHRRNLQLIGLHDPGRRWVLKYAGHLFCVDALLAAYPDALVIRTHRAPGQVIASMCSMVRQLADGRSALMTDAAIGRAQLDLWEEGLTAFDEARSRHDPAAFLDVDFAEFVADPLRVIEGVYRRLGAELTEPARTAMTQVLAAEAGLRSHRYTLADFGLTGDEVEARLGKLA